MYNKVFRGLTKTLGNGKINKFYYGVEYQACFPFPEQINPYSKLYCLYGIHLIITILIGESP